MTVSITTEGGYLISKIVNGQREKFHYIGYTRKEAIALFKEYLKVKANTK
jgi:hypothetical protein